MERKIDKRKHYAIIIDTETANTMRTSAGQLDTSSALPYDVGYRVVDIPHFNVYEERSFVVRDVFVDMRDVMKTAYYADKIPRYVDDLRAGLRTMASALDVYYQFRKDVRDYNITTVIAHNARFDYNVLNTFIRYITKSEKRYFMPCGVEIWDSMKMARDVIHKMPTYRKFCEQNNFFTASGKLPTTAEVLYRFISKDPTFKESHTGLEDVQIEAEIAKYCFRQHKKMRKKLFEKV